MTTDTGYISIDTIPAFLAWVKTLPETTVEFVV